MLVRAALKTTPRSTGPEKGPGADGLEVVSVAVPEKVVDRGWRTPGGDGGTVGGTVRGGVTLGGIVSVGGAVGDTVTVGGTAVGGAHCHSSAASSRKSTINLSRMTGQVCLEPFIAFPLYPHTVS